MGKLLKSLLLLAVVTAIAAALGYRFWFHVPQVAAVEAQTGRLVERIHAPATIQARYPITVGTRIAGSVTELYVDVGDTVSAGDRLARLDDRELAARLTVARAERELAAVRHRRDRDLFEKDQGFVSRSELDTSAAEAKAAEAREKEAAVALSHARISAPADGVITARLVELGQALGAGAPLFRMVDPQTLWTAARVDETVVGRLAVGQPTTITLRTGEELPGKVARIGLESDAATRELEVNVAFVHPPERFAIDLEAQVAIRTGERVGVIIPASALAYGDDGPFVMVIRDGRVLSQPVLPGPSEGKKVMIEAGVASGDLVVAAPQQARPGQRAAPVRREP